MKFAIFMLVALFACAAAQIQINSGADDSTLDVALEPTTAGDDCPVTGEVCPATGDVGAVTGDVGAITGVDGNTFRYY